MPGDGAAHFLAHSIGVMAFDALQRGHLGWEACVCGCAFATNGEGSQCSHTRDTLVAMRAASSSSKNDAQFEILIVLRGFRLKVWDKSSSGNLS